MEPGSYRYLGKMMPDIQANEVPVGGRCLAYLAAEFNAVGYQIGRTHVRNAVVLEKRGLRFLYVRPRYQGYRHVGLATFCGSNFDMDFDHVVARSLAEKLGLQYVLLTRISKRSNRSHGPFECRITPEIQQPTLCYADRRIWDKWLGRPPTLFGRSVEDLSGFSAQAPGAFGLTLKQKGKWAQAIGFDEDYALPPTLKPIRVRA